MADMNDLARMLFPSARDVIIEALGDMPDVSVTAVVTQGSEDGVARVDFLGESTSGEDEETSLEIPTSDHLEEGDEIVVTMKDGVPLDARRIGSGDRVVLRIDQTESDITYNFSVYQDYTEANDAAVESLGEQVAENSSAIDENSQALADEVAERTSFIRFSVDEYALPQMEMGAEGYPKSMLLGTDKLHFRDGDEVVASVEDGSLDIQNARVRQTLQFGDFAFIPRANGNLKLAWIGGDE